MSGKKRWRLRSCNRHQTVRVSRGRMRLRTEWFGTHRTYLQYLLQYLYILAIPHSRCTRSTIHTFLYISHSNIKYLYIPFWFFSSQTSSLSCFGTEGRAGEDIQYPTMHSSNQTWHDFEPQDILRSFVLPMPSNVEPYPMLISTRHGWIFQIPLKSFDLSCLTQAFCCCNSFCCQPMKIGKCS